MKRDLRMELPELAESVVAYIGLMTMADEPEKQKAAIEMLTGDNEEARNAALAAGRDRFIGLLGGHNKRTF